MAPVTPWRQGKQQISLARAISKYGLASRTQAAAMIREGRVSINGTSVRSPDVWVDPQKDRIAVDGELLRKQTLVYVAMNKPAGVVTTRSDERGRKTVYDLLPAGHRWLFPIGRLDKETSGLLLLTNDTRFGERLTNPLEKVPKTYRIRVDRLLEHAGARAMRSGMRLSDGTQLLPAEVSISPAEPDVFTMTIREGKNRQIRRMCETLGYTVLSLKRLSIGPVTLGNLAEGNVRPLTRAERNAVVPARTPARHVLLQRDISQMAARKTE